jgi:hypothetical protein
MKIALNKDLIISALREDERTPTVCLLLQLIENQTHLIENQTHLTEVQHAALCELQAKLIELDEEIKRLKGLKGRPKISPSTLDKPPSDGSGSGTSQDSTGQGNSGSGNKGKKNKNHKNRQKTSQLTIHEEKHLTPDNLPEGSRFKGTKPYVVQDLRLTPWTTKYLREKWQLPDGRVVTAPLPGGVSGSHFGGVLQAFTCYQYHHQHVTQSLLLEQLRAYGIDISAGQLSNLLVKKKEDFHREKNAIFDVGLAHSEFIQADDTGARHMGKNGYCTFVGNDFFSFFESTNSKSRINFLKILRNEHKDYRIDVNALEYMEHQRLPAYVFDALTELIGEIKIFETEPEFTDFINLLNTGLNNLLLPGHIKTITEGALIGSILSHGFFIDMKLISDDAGQFNIFQHGLCWFHAERKIKAFIPCNPAQVKDQEEILDKFWNLYQALKAYKIAPSEAQAKLLTAEFDAMTGFETKSAPLKKILAKLASDKEELLLVLKYPNMPLHNNLSERDIREYVKKRKISGSTRSEDGRRARDTFASLKKTGRKNGVNFWNYLLDRMSGLSKIPQLDQIVKLKLTASTP